jgi:hypothetical protein
MRFREHDLNFLAWNCVVHLLHRRRLKTHHGFTYHPNKFNGYRVTSHADRPVFISHSLHFVPGSFKLITSTGSLTLRSSLISRSAFQSLAVENLWNWSSRFWSIGANAAETIFDAGARKSHRRTIPRRLRQYCRHVPSDRANRLPAGGGQPFHRTHPGSANRAAGNRG